MTNAEELEMRACQVHCLAQMSEPVGALELVWMRRRRLKHILRVGAVYIKNWLLEVVGKRAASSGAATQSAESLQAGDLVRVRSREDIEKTLDRRNRLRRCWFMDEMWPYCGTTQRVLKRVERFVDERDHLTKKCSGVILLEGALCSGTKDYGRCDRACYYFWREEWLEKVN